MTWRYAILIGLIAFAQQRAVPGTPQAVTGTGEISGVVMSAETQPKPLRRVIVSIAGDPLPSPRSVITDDAGRFAFGKLPAGTYAITAKKAAYLETEFGSSNPGRPGSRLALVNGERRAITLTMFRGAAVGGTLRSSTGSPMAGVGVFALNVHALGQRDTGEGDPAITNDRGEYRMYGLKPGEYVIVATPAPGGSGEMGERSSTDMDALLASLKERQALVNNPTAPPRPPLPAPPAVGYAAIYFPGTPLLTEAAKIRLAPGEERNASFEVARVPVATIEGTISGAVQNLQAVQLAILPEARGFRGEGLGGGIIMPYTFVPPNQQGEFKYGNLSPGRYQVVARAPSAATGEILFATADLDIHGQNMKGLSLALRPGGVVAGMVVFQSSGTYPPLDISRVRVGVSIVGETYFFSSGGLRVGNLLSDVPLTPLDDDSTFWIGGIGPSRYTITCSLPPELARVWKLRSAMSGGRDLLDSELTGPDLNLRGVIITLSDKRTELTGSLQSASGQPAADYFVVAFSADRANWRPGSRRSMSARPATNGRFAFSDLPAGEYLIAALTDLDPDEWQEAAFLEQIAPAAIKITLAEGEKKNQDLRIR